MQSLGNMFDNSAMYFLYLGDCEVMLIRLHIQTAYSLVLTLLVFYTCLNTCSFCCCNHVMAVNSSTHFRVVEICCLCCWYFHINSSVGIFILIAPFLVFLFPCYSFFFYCSIVDICCL